MEHTRRTLRKDLKKKLRFQNFTNKKRDILEQCVMLYKSLQTIFDRIFLNNVSYVLHKVTHQKNIFDDD